MTLIGCQIYCLRYSEQLRIEKNAIFEPIENSKNQNFGQVLCQEEGRCESGDPKSLQTSLVGKPKRYHPSRWSSDDITCLKIGHFWQISIKMVEKSKKNSNSGSLMRFG